MTADISESTKDALLVINVGSSSIKFALYQPTAQQPADPPQSMLRLFSGKIVNIGQTPALKALDASGNDISQSRIANFTQTSTHASLVKWLLVWLHEHNKGITLRGVGHRVVHGGQDFIHATLITPKVMAQLKELVPLAPLHQGHNLAAIDSIAAWAPTLPQVACFDTSFHHTQSRLAQLFAIPRKYTEKGIIRYGFHGLSYQYIAAQLPKYIDKSSAQRVIVAHLGNGASMCALKDSKSVASSMGFTALDGLMMGQRCGSIDAGVILHLLQHYKMPPNDIEHLLYKESGLLGVSGISNSMHVLQQSDDPHAVEAIALYCYRAARELGSLVATLDGIDAIVFTAGIGENSALVRKLICAQLTWLGVVLDEAANDTNHCVISHKNSRIKVLVIPTNEELVIAQATQDITHQLDLSINEF